MPKFLAIIAFLILASIICLTGYAGFLAYKEAVTLSAEPLKYAGKTISSEEKDHSKIDLVIKNGVLGSGVVVINSSGEEKFLDRPPFASYLPSSGLLSYSSSSGLAINDDEEEKWIEVFSAGISNYALQRTLIFFSRMLATTAILLILIGFPIAWLLDKLKDRQERKKAAA